MTYPVSTDAFRSSGQGGGWSAQVVDGLPTAIDQVAAASPPSHSFLRRGWFAAAIDAYGGQARTLVVERAGVPALALPLVGTGPAFAGLAMVPGCYWPFRSFPVAGLDEAGWTEALRALAGTACAIRIGPVYDRDAGAAPLIAAGRDRGWVAIDRFVAHSWLLDLATVEEGGTWPRGSTLRKNRFHEKHLAAHGALGWRFVTGTDWTPAAFDGLAKVEQASWIAARTDGCDAKFTAAGHGTFWRAAANDPVIAAMMRAAVLDVDDRVAAFSFNLDAGELRYAIANSYDPSFAKHSPGKLLQYRDMTDGLARGLAAVDWGAGDSGYKQVIGAEQGPALRDWLLLRPGLPALAGRLLASAWRRSGNTES
ncbi:GNAT family N-acetyltransferase [Sphingomonas aerophila]|uniref:CelD/BcsL family acetyltransferase involved in cellulose biosynthesis n=1 Tax=Sphingomonas aerophila TaxID=1344948 RepID=A0A7W9BC29_9SPHN|nr:GNAT family N-acetyltransferase [Sphingomonas aerophila]MBB5714465.1 CelD/BcsL family acetyltransferase involved in cellulose biosynthesis [Sphingomonas aerophila]